MLTSPIGTVSRFASRLSRYSAIISGYTQRLTLEQTLDIIQTAFPRALGPYLPDFLTAMLRQLQVLYPTYQQYYVLATDAIPLSSEDEKIELSQLASATLDFISTVTRSPKAKSWFDEATVSALVGDVFKWTVMTADEVSTSFPIHYFWDR